MRDATHTRAILTNLFKQNNHSIHKAHTNFLSLAIDPGYHIRWFKVIKKLNWDYLGRVRGSKHII